MTQVLYGGIVSLIVGIILKVIDYILRRPHRTEAVPSETTSRRWTFLDIFSLILITIGSVGTIGSFVFPATNIEIINPTDQDQIEILISKDTPGHGTFRASGKLKSRSDLKLYLLVKRDPEPHWKVQISTTPDFAKGTWRAIAWLSNPNTGNVLNIMAVLTTNKAIQDEEHQSPSELQPKAQSNIVQVTVK